MKWFGVIILYLLLFIIAAITGVIYHFIESNNESLQSSITINQYNNFRTFKPCLNGVDTQKLYQNINQLNKVGIYLQNDRSFTSTWDVPSSIYMALQVTGAIGFGGSPPQTIGGKAFLVFYAIIGIPLFLTIRFGMSWQILKLSEYLRSKLKLKNGLKTKWLVVFYRTSLALLFGLIFFAIIPAGIFQSIDPTLIYGDTVNLLATVATGYGSFVPNDYSGSWYRLLVGVFSILSSIYFHGVIYSVKYSIRKYKRFLVKMPQPLEQKSKNLMSIVEIGKAVLKNDYAENKKNPEVDSHKHDWNSTLYNNRNFSNNPVAERGMFNVIKI